MLKADNFFISFGGEIKEQLFTVNHEHWDADPQGTYMPGSDRPYLLQRFMFHTNINLSSHLRIFGELKSGFESGRLTGHRPNIDQDKLDLGQAFLDLDIFPGQKNDLLFRIGRQELDYGASRFISENEGPNLRLSFEGYKAILKTPWLVLDGFLTRPVDNLPGVFDDKVNKDNKLYGVYTTFPLSPSLKNSVDIYFIGNSNRRAVYVKGSGAENRNSWGIRFYRTQRAPVTYDLEATYQNGRFADKVIRAYGLLARLNYNFSGDGMFKTLSLVGQITSGDQGKDRELNTFNPLYPRVYYGIGAPYWPSNIKQFTPSADLRLAERLVLTADVHFLWRENKNDGLYFVNPVRSANSFGKGVSSRHSFIGAQQDLDVTWSIKKFWSVEGISTYIPETAYISDSGHGTSILFAGIQSKFSF